MPRPPADGQPVPRFAGTPLTCGGSPPTHTQGPFSHSALRYRFTLRFIALLQKSSPGPIGVALTDLATVRRMNWSEATARSRSESVVRLRRCSSRGIKKPGPRSGFAAVSESWKQTRRHVREVVWYFVLWIVVQVDEANLYAAIGGELCDTTLDCDEHAVPRHTIDEP